MFLSRLPKRKTVLLVLFALFALGSIFLVLQNIFQADVLGAYTISGQIYAADSKAPVDGADIILTSSQEDTSAITAKTNAQGQYSLSAPDKSYANILITKNNYWDIDGVIVNSGGLTNLNFNTTLRSGFGKEDTQIVTLKKKGYRQKTTVGLSLSPFDDAPQGLKQIVPAGNTYKEESFKERFSTYDFQEGQEIDANPLNFKFSDVGTLPETSDALSATYVPDTDRYYLIFARAIYEYDRNNPSEAYKVAELPYESSKVSSIYVNNISSVIIAAETEGTTMLYLFKPAENKLSNALATLDYSPKVIFQIQDNLYFVIEDPYKDKKTYLSKLDLSDTNENQLKNPTLIKDISLDLIETTPYYDSLADRIYFVGGKDQNNAELDSIFEFNPNDNTLKQHAKKLPYPIANAVVYSPIPNRYYFIGGTTTGNQPLLDKITFYETTQNAKTKEVQTFSSGGTNNFKLLNPVTSQNAVQDNSGRLFFFNQNVQKLAPKLTLSRGQAYSFESGKDYTIVFKGRAKTDEFSFTPKDIQENNWQSASPVKFANPYLRSITLSDITLNYQDKKYTLKEAVDAGLISDNIFISDYPNQAQVDLNNLDKEFNPGDYLSFWRKKNGVKVILKSQVALDPSGSMIVEVPPDVSYDDIVKIAEHKENLPADEKARLDDLKQAIYTKILFDLSRIPLEKIEAGVNSGPEPIRVYLTKNGSEMNFDTLNPYYFNMTLAQTNGLIKQASAEEGQAEIKFKVDRPSFGNNIEMYNRIDNFIKTEEENIKRILKEPFFTRTVTINNPNEELFCQKYQKYYKDENECHEMFGMLTYHSGITIPTLNEIIINFDDYYLRQDTNAEAILLHEIFHSWESVIASAMDSAIVEGTAVSFVPAFNYAFEKNYSSYLMTSVTNYDYWANEVMANYDLTKCYSGQDYTMPEYFFLYYLTRMSSGEEAINFMPQDEEFWKYDMWGSTFLKLFIDQHTPSFYDETFYPKFHDELFKVLYEKLKDKYPFIQNITRKDDFEKNFKRMIELEKELHMFEFQAEDMAQIITNSLFQNPKIVESVSMPEWLLDKSALFRNCGNAPEIDSVFAVYLYPLSPRNIKDKTKNSVVFGKIGPAVKKWWYSIKHSVKSFANVPMTSRFYFKDSKKITNTSTDTDGVLAFEDELSEAKQNKYSGSIMSLFVNTNDHPRVVFAKPLFMQNGLQEVQGLFGTADVEDGTQIQLKQYGDNIVAETTVSNNIYKFTESADLVDEFTISIPSKNYNKEIIKWKGAYQHDIKTDTTAPEIEPLCDQEITTNYSYDICFKLNEPASAFVEYGEEKDKYPNISFGCSNQCDEVKDGIRTLRLEGLTSDKTYHYRIWAIDRSGNISHTDDKILDKTPISITNVQVSNITSNSATISWDTNVETSGYIKYSSTPGAINWTNCQNPFYPYNSGNCKFTPYDAKSTHHEQTLQNLSGSVKYEFKIIAAKTVKDGQGLCIQDFSGGDFTTTAAPPEPQCSETKPCNPGYECQSGNCVALPPIKVNITGPVTYDYANGTISFSTDIPAKARDGVCTTKYYYGSCSDFNRCNTTGGPQISSSADKLHHTVTNAYISQLGNNGWCNESQRYNYVVMEPDPLPTDGRTIERAYLSVANYIYPSEACTRWNSPYECSVGCTNYTPYWPYTNSPCCAANCGAVASQPISATPSLEVASLDISRDKDTTTISAKVISKETMVINPDTKIELQYGFKEGKYIKTVDVTRDAKNNFVSKITNLKARTYHIRYQITGEDNKISYSDDKTLKYGHWFPRFFNDLFGNFWDSIKSFFFSIF